MTCLRASSAVTIPAKRQFVKRRDRGALMDNTFSMLPRRHLLGYGMASLAFPQAAFGQDAKGEGFEPLPAQIKVTPKQMTINVKINEKGPFRFVIDTGSDRSVISEDLATALRLPVGRQMSVQGIIRTVTAKSALVAKLEFGAATRDNLEMPVLPRNMLQADGYLGLDTIDRHRVIFDFRKQTMHVIEPRSPWFVDRRGMHNETLIAAPGYGGHLRSVECVVDGVNTVAFIDSGAEVSVGNGPLREKLMTVSQAYVGSRDIELQGVTGGTSTARVIKVDTILLGNLEFSGCELAIADLEVFKIWDLTDKPAMLIGLNFLKEFSSVSVDFARKEYRLILTSNNTWVSRQRA